MFKKQRIRAAAAYILAVIMAFSFPIAAAASTTSTSAYTGKSYTHNSRFDGYDRHNGIDVSAHNGNINWKSVKSDGIEFAIIRAGVTGYTKSKHSINIDTLAAKNIEGAQSAGLAVGVYWFSQALNESEAIAEAKKTLEVINNYDLDLPVFFDYEFNGGDDGRLTTAWNNKTITKSQMTANARAFCEVIENAGYDAGVYANKSFFTTQLDNASLSQDYSMWLAHYTTKTDYTGDYYIWQYSSSGSVNGVSGNVDCNFMYLPQGAEIDKQSKVVGFNVYARGDGGTDLYLDWNDVAGADSYKVYTNCGPGDVLKGETDESKFTFTDLTPAWEYDVRVEAYAGDKLLAQNTAYRICAAPAPTDSLKASATGNAITATWVEQASHGYYIQWSTDKTFTNNVSGTFINGSASTSYTINVANAQDYYVRVRAWKWYQGSRVYSDFCEPVKPDKKLTAPTGFNVYARGDGGTDLYLDWDDVAGADGYRVYTNCGTGDIFKGDVKISQFTFTDLTPAWEYDAKVVAYNETGEVSAVYRICAAPAPTDSLKASATGNAITATWVEQASHGYYIQWSTDETFTKNVSGAFINGSASTSYTINVANAQDYYVRVRAWKWYQGSRLYSDFCEPVKPDKKLTAPTGFNVYARGDGGTDLYLDWDDVAGADGYRVYTNCGTGDILKGDVKISQFTFTDLTPAWEYDAKIVAYNEEGEVSAVYRICAAPAPTGSLKASATGNAITATWVEQASHGYYIQWSTDKSFTKNVSGAFINGSASTSYTINVANAQDYYVRVRAWKWYQGSRVYSDFCEPVSVSK